MNYGQRRRRESEIELMTQVTQKSTTTGINYFPDRHLGTPTRNNERASIRRRIPRVYKFSIDRSTNFPENQNIRITTKRNEKRRKNFFADQFSARSWIRRREPSLERRARNLRRNYQARLSWRPLTNEDAEAAKATAGQKALDDRHLACEHPRISRRVFY